MSQSVRIESLEDVEEEWEAILPSCSTNTVFVTPWWQRTWWRHFGEDSELRVLVFHDNDLTLGIAPLMLRDGVIGFLGDTDLFDYHDFLVPRGGEDQFYESLFGYLDAVAWRKVDLKSVPHNSPTIRYIPPLAERRGYTVEVVEEDVAPIAYLPSTWDEYMAGLSKKDRHELRRKIRRFEAAGTGGQHVYSSVESLQLHMEEFFRLHRISRQDKAEFLTPEREEFFLDVAVEFAARDQFKLTFLELDGVRVASCIIFDYLDSNLLYNSGYDPDYSDLSVGLLNKANAVKEAIDTGRRTFDFLRGDERYKYHLGAEGRPIYRIVIHRNECE